MTEQYDIVEKPKHYNSHPSGVECIEITKHLPFAEGNAFKYLFRRKEKGNELQDCKKALWYLNTAYGTFTNNSREHRDREYLLAEEMSKYEESPLIGDVLLLIVLSGMFSTQQDKHIHLDVAVENLEQYIEQLEQSRDVH